MYTVFIFVQFKFSWWQTSNCSQEFCMQYLFVQINLFHQQSKLSDTDGTSQETTEPSSEVVPETVEVTAAPSDNSSVAVPAEPANSTVLVACRPRLENDSTVVEVSNPRVKCKKKI